MTPTLVTAPVAPVVTLADLKLHLRVSHDDDNAAIAAMEQAAVAHLDGWRGIFGRAIMPQTWRQTFTCSGPYRFAMPDVSDVVVTADDVTVTGVVTVDATGPLVTLEVSPAAVIVEYTCALPATLLPAAQAAVKLYVDHLHFGSDLAPAFHALVAALRWKGV